MNGSSSRIVSPPTAKLVVPSRMSTSSGSNGLNTMSPRVRNGSSASLRAGITAIPPAGSDAIASAFASATRSTLPRSSRCSGPMCGTTTTCGCAISQSAEIWPSPRIPISVTRICVSGSSRHTVSGRPISLFRLFSAQIVRACGAQSAPRMSFVVVLPAEPTTATTCASLFERTSEASAANAASWSSGTSVAAPRARASATNATPAFSATNRSPARTSRESALIPMISPPPSSTPSSSATTSSQYSGITTSSVARLVRRRGRRMA